jgi:predicted small secreted protein
MKSLFKIAAASLALVAVLGGCNTVEGAGKDVSAGGDHVQDAAKDVKNKM